MKVVHRTQGNAIFHLYGALDVDFVAHVNAALLLVLAFRVKHAAHFTIAAFFLEHISPEAAIAVRVMALEVYFTACGLHTAHLFLAQYLVICGVGAGTYRCHGSRGAAHLGTFKVLPKLPLCRILIFNAIRREVVRLLVI